MRCGEYSQDWADEHNVWGCKMIVGCLGDIVFRVNNRAVSTINNMLLTGTTRVAMHDIVGNKTKIEYIGSEARGISFEMTLCSDLGVNVDEEIKKIEKYAEVGKTLPLVIGKKMYGSYRWIILKYTIDYKLFNRAAQPQMVIVKITLAEYIK
jgi:hypothetical protein